MVILVQCAKSSQRKWLNISQDAYLTNTKGFSKYGVGLVLGPKIFFGGGVLWGRTMCWGWAETAGS